MSNMSNWTLMVYISADDVLANFAVESLKQLKQAADKDMVVFAQFDPNVPGKSVSRYVFNDTKKDELSIENNVLLPRLRRGLDMTEPQHLKSFVNIATAQCPAKHFALVLWGHGPELLFDDDAPSGAPPSKRKYLTPANLRKALEGTDLVKGKLGNAKLDIVAIDACCGALLELAIALQGCSTYLIASQDEVPDASFPYEHLLAKLKPNCTADDVEPVAKMLPTAYEEAFQDYISTPANGLFGITLSTVNLQKIDTITAELKPLVTALLDAVKNPALRKKILAARSKSHDFEFGLFVDLFDFCDQLGFALGDNSVLAHACKNMQTVIDDKQCIIANQGGENSARCHGISVYFPYQTGDVTQNTVLLSKNNTTHGTKDRIGRIQQLEEDYAALAASRQTAWMDFIKRGWSLILAKEVPAELDKHYSAQQCAQNLLTEEDVPGAPPSGGPPPSGTGDTPSAEYEKSTQTAHGTNGGTPKMAPHQFGTSKSGARNELKRTRTSSPDL